MKKLTSIISLFLLLSFSACTTEGQYGSCIGLFDKDKMEKKNPNLIYKLNGWNTFLAVMGTCLLFIPTIYVIANSTFCPDEKIAQPITPSKIEEDR